MIHDLSPQSHDAYFKEVFSDPKPGADFFEGHLPHKLVATVKWESLALVPGSFVKQSLQQAHWDLLFSVTAGGRDLVSLSAF